MLNHAKICEISANEIINYEWACLLKEKLSDPSKIHFSLFFQILKIDQTLISRVQKKINICYSKKFSVLEHKYNF